MVTPGTGPPAPSWVRSTWRGLVADPRHGPLPALLLVLTVLSGVVDAISILSLGRVFVANMTGNVVFIGFAAVGAAGFSLSASVTALVGFLLGASVGGPLASRQGAHRGVLLRTAVVAELVLVTGALLVAVSVGSHPGDAGRNAMAGVLAIAMGLQNAVVRRLAVPDLTTTVLTMTLTGIAADLREGRWSPALTRRLLAVAAMFAGAVAGALLVLRVSQLAAFILAAGLLAVSVAAAATQAQRPAPWQSPG